MKTVFSNSELPHIWARQSQDEGRTPNGSMFFDGTRIYSYGRHFCIADIVQPGVVLFTTRGYSNTTAKHKHHVSYACNHMRKVYVNDPSGSFHNNITEYSKAIRAQLDIISSTRRKQSTKDAAYSELASLVNNINEYCAIKGEQSSDPEFLAYFQAAQSFDFQELDERIKRVDQERKAIEEQARLEAIAKAKAALAKWKRGGNVPTYSLSAFNEVYLRAKYDNVETSKGARVSLESARRLYSLIKSGKDIKGHDIDGYTVIGLNGSLHIGCHDIGRKEIERFARKQGW